MINLIILIFLIYLLRRYINFNLFELNSKMKITKIEDDIFVIDNFYKYPNILKQNYINKQFGIHNSIYKTWYYNPDLSNNIYILNLFEKILNITINKTSWNLDTNNNSNGHFQYITNINTPCIHSDDLSDFAAVVYLGDNLHSDNGTSFYQHIQSGLKILPTHEQMSRLSKKKINMLKYYEKNHLWKEGEPPQFNKWKKYYQCKNIFNRAIIFNSKRFHCAEKGYGDNKYNSRFFQTFFFNINN